MTSDAHQHFGPPILGIRTRIRGYTIAQQLDEAAPGTREMLAADAAGACVVLRVPDNERMAHRMKAEANLAQRHLSSAIVQSVGLLEHDAWPVQVLEHVDGLRLDTLTLLYGALPAEAACRVGWKIGVALSELHGKKPVMAHGALSAERIIVDAHGQPRLRDLGRIDPDQHEHMMSPERREVLGGPSAADDLFALGLIVAEAALGHPLELGDGFLDPKILAGLMPDRLVDALAALLAPEEQRLSNAAAAVRVLVELEYALADGEAALRNAVEKARLGMAFGGLAQSDEEAVAPMTAPDVPSPMAEVTDMPPTETAAKVEAFAEEEPTIPSAPPVVSPVEETKTAFKQRASPAKPAKPAKAEGTAAVVDNAKLIAAKKSSAALVAGLLGAFLVMVALPASIAFTLLSALHSALDSVNNDMPPGLVDTNAKPAFDLGALDATHDVKMPGMPTMPKMPTMPTMPKMPTMPTMPTFASLERMLGVGAATATPDDAQQLSPEEAKAAADLKAAFGAAIAQGVVDDKNAKPLEVVTEHMSERAAAAAEAVAMPAKTAFVAGNATPVKSSFTVTSSSKPAKKTASFAKAEKPAAEKHAARPSALSFEEPAAKTADKPLPKVKLVAGVDGGMRAAAEAAVRSCRVANGTVGVIHPGGASTVTTEPRNSCADRALTRALRSFKGSDEPLELDVVE